VCVCVGVWVCVCERERYDPTNRNFIKGTADRNMINVYNSSQAGAKFRE
jgi:hypothetical protein